MSHSSLLAQAPNWDSVYADYFIKYEPVDTPAWLFPMCFKDYNGEWDTVYFGHDPNASWGFDTMMGEQLQNVDTSIFNVFFYGSLPADTMIGKVLLFQLIPSQGISIKFTKGNMPLTMYWNDSLFYSDSLPFPDLDPLPRARGELWCSDFDPQYSNCPTGYPIVMTDNPDSISQPFPPPWSTSDSIFFDGDTTDFMGSTLMLYIVPYSDSWGGIESKNGLEQFFNFFPNPVSIELNIENKKRLPFTYTIYDYIGHRILSSMEIKELTTVDFSALANGIYFIKIEVENKSAFYTEKIIKTN